MTQRKTFQADWSYTVAHSTCFRDLAKESRT
jgi:hypothetical protein